MKFPFFLRKKSTYLILVLVLAGGAWFVRARSNAQKITYETAPVERRDLERTVEVTGEIKPADRIDLAFKNSGTVDQMNVKVGDVVKTGQLIATLKANDVHFAERNAAAALAASRASLNARLSGETTQSIHLAETQVEQSRAAYEKALADLASIKSTTANTVQSAEIALQTASNNLANQKAIISQTVQNAYESAKTQLLTALGPLNTALNDGDQISGVDNTAASQLYANFLGVLQAGSLERAKASYHIAKDAKVSASVAVSNLTAASSKEAIQSAAESVYVAIGLIQAYLSDVQTVLANSLTSASFTATDLAAKRTTIDADRTSVSAQNTSVLSATQTIKNTELTETQTAQQLHDAYQSALTARDTAVANAASQVQSASSTVNIQKAALDASLAALSIKRAPPREVDVAPLRASVAQAAVAYEKALHDLENVQVLAPVDGTISEILPSVGEQVAMNAPVIRMVGTSQYDIEAKVPEADITKIEVGQLATITLDAYGDDVKFTGKVTAKDPAETKVQDAIYYQIRIQVDPAGREVKPGMTANITVRTGLVQQAIVIPLRAVRTAADGERKTVRVLINGQPAERVVELGLKGDEGRVEVLSGLIDGESVIVGEKNPSVSGQTK